MLKKRNKNGVKVKDIDMRIFTTIGAIPGVSGNDQIRKEGSPNAEKWLVFCNAVLSTLKMKEESNGSDQRTIDQYVCHHEQDSNL
jgi:hypothetical protein